CRSDYLYLPTDETSRRSRAPSYRTGTSGILMRTTPDEKLRRSADHSSHGGTPVNLWRPSGLTIGVILLGAIVLIVVAFFAGYLPHEKRMAQITAEAHEQEQALPRVEVVEVRRA